MKLPTAIFALLLLATNTATVLAAADGDVLDVAIIGAGTAGPYAGWRILSSPGNEDLNVELFERSVKVMWVEGFTHHESVVMAILLMKQIYQGMFMFLLVLHKVT